MLICRQCPLFLLNPSNAFNVYALENTAVEFNGHPHLLSPQLLLSFVIRRAVMLIYSFSQVIFKQFVEVKAAQKKY